MARWTEPLTKERIEELVKANEKNGPITMMDGPIGPMVKVECTTEASGSYRGTIFYCGGGDPFSWLKEDQFVAEYPDWFIPHKMPAPEFDLDDMELAEIIMEELK